MGSLVDASTPDTGADAADVAFDGSVFDEAGVASFSGDWWNVCLDQSYAGDVNAAVYDVLHLTFTSGGGGTVTVQGSRQALKLGATNVSDTVGEVVTIPATPVGPSGFFSAHVATFITPKEATVFGVDLTVENGVYNFTASSPSRGCGHFLANVTSPIPQAVDETCVFTRPAADGSFTPLTSADPIHCP